MLTVIPANPGHFAVMMPFDKDFNLVHVEKEGSCLLTIDRARSAKYG